LNKSNFLYDQKASEYRFMKQNKSDIKHYKWVVDLQ